SELDARNAAGPSPRVVSLPNVDILICGRVVAEATTTRGNSRCVVTRAPGVSGRDTRLRITCSKDVKALIAAEAERDRYRAAILDVVDHRWVQDCRKSETIA